MNEQTPEDLGLDLGPADRQRFRDFQFAGYTYSLMLNASVEPDDCERLFDAGVSEQYALLGLKRGISTESIIQRWNNGVPMEYLV